jgi:predicted DNA-binding transcriptional regulator AlpA
MFYQPKKFLLLDRRAQQIASIAIGADPDLLLDTRQTAEWLTVSVVWLEIGRSKGYGPPFRKLGTRSVRYRVGDVIAWLETRKQIAENKTATTAEVA